MAGLLLEVGRDRDTHRDMKRKKKSSFILLKSKPEEVLQTDAFDSYKSFLKVITFLYG